jgi:hypothetical protein
MKLLKIHHSRRSVCRDSAGVQAKDPGPGMTRVVMAPAFRRSDQSLVASDGSHLADATNPHQDESLCDLL